MCKAFDAADKTFAPHERLDQYQAGGGVMKGPGGAPKAGDALASTGKLPERIAAQEVGRTKNRFLLRSMLVLASCLVLNQMGLFVPMVMIARNCISPTVPPMAKPSYPQCSAEVMAKEMTIVVTVKDACSQAPGFIRALETFAPPGVHLIYTYPNFESCAKIDLSNVLKRWNKVTVLPLPLRSSPMQGWVDAIPYIKTKYSMLLHNDGYALDSFFGCELLRALEHRQATEPESNYFLAAPMLYESKMDGSLAAHATQSNLRLVKDGSALGMTVHHDHSLRRALNRGNDFKEGEQADFIEDHGFLIQTDKIKTVIDPSASFTLEYLDMIMTIRANNWKVLFVPSARLEFRITEFSWRDIPYFMYKRSEATAHGTRDYLISKWGANFPNTGFWTYIKYTIIEQHLYRDGKGECAAVGGGSCLDSMRWKDQASLVFGFFQMAGYNRYAVNGKEVDFLDVLQRLDRGWSPKAPVAARRELVRKQVKKTRPRFVDHLSEILPYGKAKRVEVGIEHEYLPFSMAKLAVDTCDALTPEVQGACGLVVQEADGSCACWINMPTFKSNSLFIRFLARFAAMIKVPSRVTTFVEMTLSGSRNGTEHVAPLRPLESSAFSLVTCDLGQEDCSTHFTFSRQAKLKLFRGAPATVADVQRVVQAAGACAA